MESVKYIGLDVHQTTISVAVLNAEGKLVMQSVLATHAAIGKRYLILLGAGVGNLCGSVQRTFITAHH